MKLFLACPNSWTAISNGERISHLKTNEEIRQKEKEINSNIFNISQIPKEFALFEFEETGLLPTYSMGFCAGNFVEVHDITYNK